jgi:hypothetical protein
LLLQGVALLPATAQEKPAPVENPLEYIRDKAVAVSIVTRVVGNDRVNIWKTRSERITVSGKSVNVILEGDELKVQAHIIPFVHEDGTILLIAKGEVWSGSGDAEDIEYYTTVRSLPIEPGESVIFFPVGLAVDSAEQVYTIELEIQVQPYE